MTTIFKQYCANLRADAAYVDCGSIDSGQVLQDVDLRQALTRPNHLDTFLQPLLRRHSKLKDNV
jgi:hypothetical protein